MSAHEAQNSAEEVEYEEVEVSESESEAGEQPATSTPGPSAAGTPLPPVQQKYGTPSTIVTAKGHQAPPQSTPAPPPPAPGKLDATKNPFTHKGSWTADEFSQITVTFPVLGTQNETTNELTRSNRPEARYWKGDIMLSYESHRARTLRIYNVPVPYHNGKGYGESFIYIGLPGFMERVFAAAGKTMRPTVTAEKALVPDANYWWKIVNDVSTRVGVIDANTKQFRPINLATVLESTLMGVTLNLEIGFVAKASTADKTLLKASTPFSVGVTLNRGYIATTDVDVTKPRRVPRVTHADTPKATRADVATEGVMSRLAALGL